MQTIESILEHCFEHKLNRSSCLIAFGGGVIGDMTGFCASIYQRGIDFIQIPTTLLSQVDASVGGKTGINNKFGKNLIGAFHQPRSVYINSSFLDTLPKREFGAGVAEVIKMAVCFNTDFFEWLENNDLRDKKNIDIAIQKSVETKAWVVSQDEKEKGLRAALNYGHTFGHVVENETKYEKYLHGEAVGIGMVMANNVSVKLGIMSEDEASRVKILLEKYDIPTGYEVKDVEDFYEHFFLDKKALDDKIKEKVAQLKFHIKELTNSKDIQIIKTIYTNTINAQNALLNFVNNNILLEKQIMLDPNQIFRLVSNNIEFITLLYKANFKELNQMLYTRIKNKETIAYIIVISAFASVIFILYINLLFYRKNKKYIEQIKLLSITDGMTKLFNRRHFDNEFIKQLKIQKRISQNLTFIIMDIDHFKQYNDLYGHKEGDMALINVAQCLELNLQRPSDIAFRLGGEEFGILCTDMNKSNSLLFANKIRTSIENLKIEHKGSSTNKFITISIGLIIIEPNTIYEIDNIYKCADEALYTAKRNGRNQVIVYDIENRNNSVVECDLPIN